MKTKKYAQSKAINQSKLIQDLVSNESPIEFVLELTPRCNLDCRHCYIRMPANDCKSKDEELKLDEIKNLIDQAKDLGAISAVLTGGEPLLRPDFHDIYAYLKKSGFFVFVFTNACLIKEKHINLFKKMKPSAIEVTTYGASESVYEQITRVKGSFAAFKRGVNLLVENQIPITMKSMLINSNYEERLDIRNYCQSISKLPFRWDAYLIPRFDGDPKRQAMIEEEQVSPENIIKAEAEDELRFNKTHQHKAVYIDKGMKVENPKAMGIFRCFAGLDTFAIAYNGEFRLCENLIAPGTTLDLRQNTLEYAIKHFVPEVRSLISTRAEYLEHCATCELLNSCPWCVAAAYLETGRMDAWVPKYCKFAEAKADLIESADE